MKAAGLGITLLPPEAMALLLMLAGLFLIVGLRKLAGTLAVFALVGAVMPAVDPLMDAILEELPMWVSWLLLLGFVFFVLSVLGLSRFFRDVMAHTAGTLLADVIRFLLLLPFRTIALIYRVIIGRVR